VSGRADDGQMEGILSERPSTWPRAKIHFLISISRYLD
jgi:hypothetical protein